jgi:hypothetical protein
MTTPAGELRTAATEMRRWPGRASEPIAKLLEETAEHMEFGSGTEGVPIIDATIAVARAINGGGQR